MENLTVQPDFKWTKKTKPVIGQTGHWSVWLNHTVSREIVNTLKKAMLAGGSIAVITWCTVYFSIHQPSYRSAGTGRELIIRCPDGDDDDLTALLWAAGSYIVTFTPTLLFLHGRTRRDAFTRGHSIG